NGCRVSENCLDAEIMACNASRNEQNESRLLYISLIKNIHFNFANDQKRYIFAMSKRNSLA
ncbi:MAG: hypothetical protein K2I48_03465, partial [Muribaculaceae bacterium]|nr:hypothetical protein [Muribaculaceae bacterium]